jgi:tetratricopeptide (TPR) repeat protein
LERAVVREPNRPEAWFNLGLAAEAAAAPARARDAWTRYLAIDPSSEWAGEAREHLDKLQPRDRVR